MKKYITYFLIGLAICFGFFATGLIVGKRCKQPMATIITTIDTVLISNPAPIHVEIIDKYKFPKVPTLAYFVDSIPTPYFVHDTLVIPIEQKVYQSEQYKAWISGFKPQLDSIMIYNTTHTVIQPQVANKPSLWGLYAEVGGVVVPHTAVYAGIEAELKIKEFTLVSRSGIYYPRVDNKINPYVMVGLKYNLR